MATTHLKGGIVHTIGELPKTGQKVPDFLLTKTDMTDVTLKDFKGKKLVFNIFLSIDTSVCAASVRKFNAEISKIPGTVCLCVSLDLPFSHNRFCAAEGLNNVVPLSEFRNRDFGKAYGVRMGDGPMAGLLARSIIMTDARGIVKYPKLVDDISTEPDYEKALAALK